MNDRNTVIRSMHDLGLAVWTGGALMGAVGLNGATAKADDPTERLRLSSLGWARWAPVNAAAIAVHGVGGLGLILANRKRVAGQKGTQANTVAKTVVTLAAAGATAYAGVLGRKVDAESHQGGQGATEPSTDASPALKTAQQHLKITQWAIPALTAVLVVMTAQQGEQQKPGQQLRDRLLSR
ncbi:hypothetical protein [Solicola sp. PLA-1-18]|uniref:hypothetical protein n=1 Tax=Solicola sp. PLA-1-18 TaxID=3380532 RepID=UPI003B7FB313